MISLAVKYRPTTFNDVVAQENIKAILEQQIVTKNHKNCYLFTGGAGTGKTTCARIFANELNGGKGKAIEIDAASNNGVENVRNIIDDSKHKSLDGEFKIYVKYRRMECHVKTFRRTSTKNNLFNVYYRPTKNPGYNIKSSSTI